LTKFHCAWPVCGAGGSTVVLARPSSALQHVMNPSNSLAEISLSLSAAAPRAICRTGTHATRVTTTSSTSTTQASSHCVCSRHGQASSRHQRTAEQRGPRLLHHHHITHAVRSPA
jgi:hypothetical protein